MLAPTHTFYLSARRGFISSPICWKTDRLSINSEARIPFLDMVDRRAYRKRRFELYSGPSAQHRLTDFSMILPKTMACSWSLALTRLLLNLKAKLNFWFQSKLALLLLANSPYGLAIDYTMFRSRSIQKLRYSSINHVPRLQATAKANTKYFVRPVLKYTHLGV